MKITTRLFGEIEIEESKIIHFANGIIGFFDCKNFILVHDEEREDKHNISWLQSIDEPAFAMAVIDPVLIKEDYNPMVDDELLKSLGELSQENTYVLVTVTIPADIKKLSVNLKAPIVINVDEYKAGQFIVEGDYPIKYAIYDILKAGKREGE
ncbi:flagellar assembly protein FliW [Lachnospiraceae bacterium ZAX-1]